MAKLFVSQRDAPLFARINEVMLQSFESHLIVRGMALYHNAGGVTMLVVDDNWIASAQVKDGMRTYASFVHLSQLPDSTCSCQSADYCEHISAVLYAVFKRFALSIATFNAAVAVAEAEKNGAAKPAKRLSPAAAPNAQRKKQSVPAEARQPGNAKAEPANVAAPADRTAPLSKPKQPRPDNSSPSPDGTVESWHRYFERTTGKPSFSPASPITSWGARMKTKLLDSTAGWQPVARKLYAIHVQFHLIRQVNETYFQTWNRYAFDYIQTMCQQAVTDWTRELTTIVFDIDPKIALSQHADLLSGTMRYLANHAFAESESIVDWQLIYRMLWWNLFLHPSWIAEERRRLKSAIAGTRARTYLHDELAMALAHLDVVEGNDARATQLLDELASHIKPEAYFGYLHAFRSSAQWARALHWLRWLLPALEQSQRAAVDFYLGVWKQTSAAVHAEDEWNAVLIRLFPASHAMYTDHAIEQGRYREWVELHIAHRILPLYADTEAMRKLAAKEPAVLLPYYHQAIEERIEAKNREGYQDAVKLLLKLRPLYDKLQLSSRWKQYLTHLARHYSRLRVFQEELRKGNLHA